VLGVETYAPQVR